MNQKIIQLESIARSIMSKSNDPIHDLKHIERVRLIASNIGASFQVSNNQLEALSLASLWHDASRTITKNPSVFLMPFFDDVISAIMLIKSSIKFGLSDTTVSLATRIILCKNIGSSALLTKIFLKKKDRILVHILQDADFIDIIHQERIIGMMNLADDKFIYKLGYKYAIKFYLNTDFLKIKTHHAKIIAKEELEKFLIWFRNYDIYNWHTNKYGRVWVEDMLKKLNLLLEQIKLDILLIN